MSDTPAKYPDLTAELRDRSLLGALKIFGPGAIIASVTIGNGETIFASRGGAIFGYTLMWCFVLGAAIKFFQVYSGARFITLTGRHPLESWAQLPGLRGWFVPVMTVLTLICMPLFLGGGLPRILGDFTNSIFGIVITPESAEVSAMAAYESKVRFDTFARIWGSLYILVAIGLTLYQTYGFLERVQTFVVGLLLFSMFVAVVASRPDLMALVQGIFIPTIPQYDHGSRKRSPWQLGTRGSNSSSTSASSVVARWIISATSAHCAKKAGDYCLERSARGIQSTGASMDLRTTRPSAVPGYELL